LVNNKIDSYHKKHTRTVVIFMVMTLVVQQLIFKFFELKTGIQPGRRNAYITTKFLGLLLFFEMLIFALNTTMKINLRDIIVSKKELVRTLIRASSIAVLMILCMIGIRIIKGHFDPKVAAKPAFKLYLNIRTRWLYPLNVFFQELFIKAFVQDNIRIMAGKEHVNYTVWLTALYFFILHMSYPLYYMVVACIFCLATGYYYETNRNIWGCALLHFVIGFFPRSLGIL